MSRGGPAEVVGELAAALGSMVGDVCGFRSWESTRIEQDECCWEVTSNETAVQVYLPDQSVNTLAVLNIKEEEWIAKALSAKNMLRISRTKATERPSHVYEITCGEHCLILGIRQEKSFAADDGIMELVEVPLEICFGRKRMTLLELESLTKDQVMVLDADVDDPIELLVAGKLLARGSAVLIDGCYGIQITEMCI